MIISKVNPAVINRPARELVPIFESLVADLRAIFLLAGLSLEGSESTTACCPSSLSRSGFPQHLSTRIKHDSALCGQANVAHSIMQQFIEDYKSYCGTSKEPQWGLATKAQSYLATLTSRTLRAPYVQAASSTPTPTPTTSLATPSLPRGQQSPYSFVVEPSSLTTNDGQNRAIVQNIQEPNRRPAVALYHINQHPVRTSGVLEIYKTVMTPLLDLLQLRSTVDDPVLRTSMAANEGAEAFQESASPAVLITDTHPGHLVRSTEYIEGGAGNSESLPALIPEPGTAENSSFAEDVGAKRKGTIAPNHVKQKKQRPVRAGVTTRSEKHRKMEIKRALAKFSKRFSSIETRQEQWKELQFLHVRWLRWEWCEKCDKELCLQCGVSSHHELYDCFQYMRSLITNKDSTGLSPIVNWSAKQSNYRPPKTTSSISKGKTRSDLDTSTIQWKLANTSPCPNCCILIHRDDGCNKMDCLLCGYRFCWVCREAWGTACGFFKCGRKPVGMIAPIDSSETLDGSNEGTINDEVQPMDLGITHELSQDIAGSPSPVASEPQNDLQRRRSNEKTIPEKVCFSITDILFL
ncbi:hypothetical protein BCR41DRAFT_194246 [Lobosporangium transversale]|uniref:RING-type domain-containing protein n=1 Tax=Lobosporangium transversale TaxID=64571 RepID=A0A1Y2GB64_9FUNG|nr:hypothetical protein BCR41DRAFT_194246 [Lobosporangium transversale]ORZ04706.1 hypothetical protein BCR41DRAFT_194246 [Lobosporangium transversale]|eukprot:XP_021876703.1 hypothetical protein BCR41DRAFT_194246 [Lobosporangium transversale]